MTKTGEDDQGLPIESLAVLQYNPRIAREYGAICDVATVQSLRELVESGREDYRSYGAIDRLAWRWSSRPHYGAGGFHNERDRREAGTISLLLDMAYPESADQLRGKGWTVPRIGDLLNPAERAGAVMNMERCYDGRETCRQLLEDTLNVYAVGWSNPLWQEHQIVHTPDIEYTKYLDLYHHINHIANCLWRDGTPGDDKRHWELAKMKVWLFRIQDPSLLNVPQIIAGKLGPEDTFYADRWHQKRLAAAAQPAKSANIAAA